jgi:hypothetical protein
MSALSKHLFSRALPAELTPETGHDRALQRFNRLELPDADSVSTISVPPTESHPDDDFAQRDIGLTTAEHPRNGA